VSRIAAAPPRRIRHSARVMSVLKHFQAKQPPVRVNKMHKNKNLEPRFDSIKSGKALERRAKRV
jgi:hypothetical protein